MQLPGEDGLEARLKLASVTRGVSDVNDLSTELPAAGVVRVVGPKIDGTGFVVSADGLIVTCAHVLAGCAPGATVSVEPHAVDRELSATVALLRDPPDVAILQLTEPVPPEVVVLPLGRSPKDCVAAGTAHLRLSAVPTRDRAARGARF